MNNNNYKFNLWNCLILLKGGKVERIYREVRGFAIPGGSEEILLDFSMR